MKKTINGFLFFFLTFLFMVNFSFSETLEEEAARRLPPVLNSLEMPEVLVSGQSYTIRWSILGYHDNYKSSVYFFDCTNTSNCGAHAFSNFEQSGHLNPISVKQGTWNYSGIYSKVFNYEYEFTPPVVAEPTDMVVRFFRLNNIDEKAGRPGLSLLIPGNITGRYYDNVGRRILKTIAPEFKSEVISSLCLLDNTGITLRRTGNTFYDDGPERLIVYELILENYDAVFPAMSLMKGTIMFAYPDYGVKFRAISVKGSYFSGSWHDNDFLNDPSCGTSIIDFVLSGTLGSIDPVLGTIFGAAGVYHDCFSNSSIPLPSSSSFHNHNEYDIVSIPFEFGTLPSQANKVQILFGIGPKEGPVLDDSSFNLDIFLQYEYLYGYDKKEGYFEESVKLPLY